MTLFNGPKLVAYTILSETNVLFFLTLSSHKSTSQSKPMRRYRHMPPLSRDSNVVKITTTSWVYTTIPKEWCSRTTAAHCTDRQSVQQYIHSQEYVKGNMLLVHNNIVLSHRRLCRDMTLQRIVTGYSVVYMHTTNCGRLKSHYAAIN